MLLKEAYNESNSIVNSLRSLLRINIVCFFLQHLGHLVLYFLLYHLLYHLLYQYFKSYKLMPKVKDFASIFIIPNRTISKGSFRHSRQYILILNHICPTQLATHCVAFLKINIICSFLFH